MPLHKSEWEMYVTFQQWAMAAFILVFCVPFIVGTHQLTSIPTPLVSWIFKNFRLSVPCGRAYDISSKSLLMTRLMFILMWFEKVGEDAKLL